MASNDEDSESLFEGMVLFDPSQILTSPPPGPFLPLTTDLTPENSLSNQPIDEDLFSDLTVVDQNSALHSETTDLTPPRTTEISLTKPASRKKKRAVRIGYARESINTTEPSSPSNSQSRSYGRTESFGSSLNDVDTRLSEDVSNLSFSVLNGNDEGERRFSDTYVEEEGDSSETLEIVSGHTCNSIEEKMESMTVECEASGFIEEVSEETEHGIKKELEKIKARISEKLEQIRESAASISAMRKECTRRKRKTANSLNLVSAKYKEFEKELEEACEAEDFERAERVSESLAAAEKEKELLMIALKDSELDCDSVDSKMQEILESQILAEEEGALLLEQFTKNASDNADLKQKDAEKLYSEELEKWSSSTEKLEMRKIEIDIESCLFNETRQEMKSFIEHSVDDDRKERELLCKKRDALTEELNKLLALVKMKEAEITENNSNLQEVEKRIAKVTSGYHEEQSCIEQKHENLQLELSQLVSEEKTLSLKRKEADDVLYLAKEIRSNIQQLCNVAEDEAKEGKELVRLRKSLISFSLKSREEKVKLSSIEEKISEEVRVLKQQVATLRTSLQELSSKRASIQQDIDSSKQRMIFIDKRCPELEAEKKVAAAARNFKEAGRISSEAKTLNLEKEEIRCKTEISMLELVKLAEEIKETIGKLKEYEELILSKEKEGAMARYKRLRLVFSTATAERSAALDLGDLEEADLLLAEAEAADSEAIKLQEAYELTTTDFEDKPNPLIDIVLVTNLGRKQLAELAASIDLAVP